MKNRVRFEYDEKDGYISVIHLNEEDWPLDHLGNRWSLKDAELIREEIEKAMSDSTLEDFCIEGLTGFLWVFPDSGEGIVFDSSIHVEELTPLLTMNLQEVLDFWIALETFLKEKRN